VHRSVLAGVPAALPALLQGMRVSEKAARVGFDWPDAAGPRAKLDEELGELDEALAGGELDEIQHELGDTLFALVSVARHAGVHPELALRSTLGRFRRRFAHVERVFGSDLESTPLHAMEAEWIVAKGIERSEHDGRPTDS
ncbi:MAG: MazG nucleotide pyrophosphohydrolase domain-containing protein, partial [Myxococcota bacterium]